MNGALIIGLSFGGLIILMLTALADRYLREGNRTKSFRERRFRQTGLELFLYGIYLLLIFGMGLTFIIGGSMLIDYSYYWGLIPIIAGVPFILDFFLFINHLLNEFSQKITIDSKNSILTIKKFGKEIVFDLKDINTKIEIYKPPFDKYYTNKDIQITGAKFGKTIIRNGKNKISISVQRRMDIQPLIRVMNPDNVLTIKRQINFIL